MPKKRTGLGLGSSREIEVEFGQHFQAGKQRQVLTASAMIEMVEIEHKPVASGQVESLGQL